MKTEDTQTIDRPETPEEEEFVLKEGDEEFIPPETPYDPLKDEEASFTPRPDSHFWNDLDLIPKSDPRYDEPPIIPLPY